MTLLRLAALFLMVLPYPAYGEEDRGPLNAHLPSWVTLGAQVRYRAEHNDRDYLLQRYRLEAALQPVAWLGFFGEFQDSRAAHYFPANAAVKDAADVRQAYVRLGREDGWWDVKAGRQRLVFGSERVIGAAEWGNTARVFDAVRLGIHHKNDRVDLFSSSVVMNSTDTWDHHRDGNNLHGIYGSFGSWVTGAKVEPYLLLRTGLNHNWTYGLRAAGTGGPRWSYEFESLGQGGREWAGTAQIKRHFRERRWQPTLLGEANYASPNLDQLYPTNHGIYGVADQIGRRNTRNVRGGVWIQPTKRLVLKAEGHSFWLASSRSGLYAANGALLVPAVPGGARHTDVGPELDLLADIRLSRHSSLGAQFGHLFAGRFLEEARGGGGATFCTVFVELHL
jgi:hypothetical protein